MTEKISKKAKRVIAVDRSDEVTRIARLRMLERNNVKYIIDSIENIDLPKNHFDVIICNDAFEHIQRPQEVLCKLSDSLKSNAMLYLTAPNIINPWNDERKLWLLHLLPREYADEYCKRYGQREYCQRSVKTSH